jgi:hypothetical protein
MSGPKHEGGHRHRPEGIARWTPGTRIAPTRADTLVRPYMTPPDPGISYR